MNTIIIPAQSAFFEGRSSINNVLFSHELLKWYSIKGLSPRYVLKVDIRNTYSFVKWFFLRNMLVEMGFP